MAKQDIQLRPLYDPRTLSDEQATVLGYKVYSHGTTYKGGNSPTVTLSDGGGSLSTVYQADFYPYQSQNGDWRLKFSIIVGVSSATRTRFSLAINGITFFNTGSGASFGQLISASSANSNAYVDRMWAENGSNTVSVNHASASTSFYGYSGDVKLASKPTWAY
jgi:hypothetical protein